MEEEQAVQVPVNQEFPLLQVFQAVVEHDLNLELALNHVVLNGINHRPDILKDVTRVDILSIVIQLDLSECDLKLQKLK